MRSKNTQRKIEHIFDFLYADYGINIKGRKIIIWFLRCRHAQSCAFISVIELPRIPAYCPKMRQCSRQIDDRIVLCSFSYNFIFSLPQNYDEVIRGFYLSKVHHIMTESADSRSTSWSAYWYRYHTDLCFWLPCFSDLPGLAVRHPWYIRACMP